MNESVSV